MHCATQELRQNVELSRISSISKDKRVANLKSTPGGQRSCYATAYFYTARKSHQQSSRNKVL